METNALGVALRHLRERNGLSIRKLGSMSGVDHAYIHRLEAGNSFAPSDDVMTALHRAMRTTIREREIVRWLINNDDTPPSAIHLALDDASISVEVFIVATDIMRARRPVDMDKVNEILHTLRPGDE